jgi:hypothetical protein
MVPEYGQKACPNSDVSRLRDLVFEQRRSTSGGATRVADNQNHGLRTRGVKSRVRPWGRLRWSDLCNRVLFAFLLLALHVLSVGRGERL